MAAMFVQTASSVDDVLTVTIPDHDDGKHLYGEPDGVIWDARADDAGDPVYPSAGDAAYVLEASDGRWVVLAWVPV